jgi:hypothetical protein
MQARAWVQVRTIRLSLQKVGNGAGGLDHNCNDRQGNKCPEEA